ncbi:hypothetical protein AVEN_168134-1, partial [Araneus ventricosus]
MKRLRLHLERILSCPYSAILIMDKTLEMGLRPSTKFSMAMHCALSFEEEIAGRNLLVLEGASRNQLLNMRNFEWLAL